MGQPTADHLRGPASGWFQNHLLCARRMASRPQWHTWRILRKRPVPSSATNHSSAPGFVLDMHNWEPQPLSLLGGCGDLEKEKRCPGRKASANTVYVNLLLSHELCFLEGAKVSQTRVRFCFVPLLLIAHFIMYLTVLIWVGHPTCQVASFPLAGLKQPMPSSRTWEILDRQRGGTISNFCCNSCFSLAACKIGYLIPKSGKMARGGSTM